MYLLMPPFATHAYHSAKLPTHFVFPCHLPNRPDAYRVIVASRQIVAHICKRHHLCMYTPFEEKRIICFCGGAAVGPSALTLILGWSTI